jgi:thiamine biosynthesis lipoprotein
MFPSFHPSVPIILLFLLGTAGCSPESAEVQHHAAGHVFQGDTAKAPFEFIRVRMGTTVRVLIHTDGVKKAESAAVAAFDRISALETILSDYNSASETRKLEQAAVGTPIKVSSDLVIAMARAKKLSAMTLGAFDVTCGPLTRLWRNAFIAGAPPSQDEIESAAGRVGWSFVGVDERHSELTFEWPGMALDFGAIGKGLAADAALEVLVNLDCPHALVDVGGDLAVGLAPPGTAGWVVGIAFDTGQVQEKVVVSQCGLATSGSAEQHLDHLGVRYSHILDPRTGNALTRTYAVTVQAADAATADAIASAVSVLGPVIGPQLVETWPGIQILANVSHRN